MTEIREQIEREKEQYNFFRLLMSYGLPTKNAILYLREDLKINTTYNDVTYLGGMHRPGDYSREFSQWGTRNSYDGLPLMVYLRTKGMSWYYSCVMVDWVRSFPEQYRIFKEEPTNEVELLYAEAL